MKDAPGKHIPRSFSHCRCPAGALYSRQQSTRPFLALVHGHFIQRTLCWSRRSAAGAGRKHSERRELELGLQASIALAPTRPWSACQTRRSALLLFLVPSALQGSETCDAEVLEIIPALAPNASQGCETEIASFQKYSSGKEKS